MAVLDLYSLFVQNVFGSVLMATVFIAIVFFVYGGIMKMGMLLIASIIVVYAMIILTGFYGGVVGAIIFLACSIYFVTSMVPWISDMFNR